MKRGLLILLLLHFLPEFPLGAQTISIPNCGFENWTAVGNYSNPDGWSTLNSLSPSGNAYPCRKGTPGDPGNSFIDLSSQMGASTVLPGMAVSGKIDPLTFRAYQGFPLNSQPASLTGNWEFMARGADQGYVSVLLTRWNSLSKTADTIAYTKSMLSGMAMGWTSFSIPIHYHSGNLPDSALIVLSASGAAPVVNSYLYVDNLAFTGLATDIPSRHTGPTALNVYPVPAKDHILLEFNCEKQEDIEISILDMLGRVAYKELTTMNSGPFHKSISLAGLSPGAYFLRVQTPEGCDIRKIQIE